MEYRDISTKFASEFFTLTDKSDQIVLTGHEFADDDSIASLLALYTLLVERYPNKNIRMCCLGREDRRLSVFRYYDKIEFYKEISDHLKDTDLLIVLDGCNYYRFSHEPEVLKAIPNRICIDHHSSKPDVFTSSLIVSDSPACSQVIYQTFFQNKKIDSDLAKVFLLGILGDTGNLSYIRPTQSETISIVKKMVDISQVNILEFQTSYRLVSRKVFSAIKEFVKNTRFISQEPNWPPFQYSHLSRNYITKHHYTDNDISEACFLYVFRYLRTISGYSWGFVITPHTNGDATISCRSLPNSVNVKDLLEEMGIGGGHVEAAGGKFIHTSKPLEPSDCLKSVLAWMHTHHPTHSAK